LRVLLIASLLLCALASCATQQKSATPDTRTTVNLAVSCADQSELTDVFVVPAVNMAGSASLAGEKPNAWSGTYTYPLFSKEVRYTIRVRCEQADGGAKTYESTSRTGVAGDQTFVCNPPVGDQDLGTCTP
jgi:hypothetical protein